MKVSELLTEINSKLDTTASEADMLEWINALEQYMYRDFLPEYETDTINIVASQATYSISAEKYKFEDIEKLVIEDVEYTKRLASTDEEEYNYTYAKSGTNIVIYPVPVTSITAGMVITTKKIPTVKTSANKASTDLDLIADFGEQCRDLYRYYCYRHACLANRDYLDANMYAQLYNEKENAFWAWYVRRMPRDMAEKRKARWR